MRAGIIEPGGVLESVFQSRLLNPTALFGLPGLDRWSHSLFWGLLLNVGFYVGVSLFTRQSDAEVRQAIIFVDSYSPAQFAPSQRPLTVIEIEDILAQYLGHGEAREAVEGFLKRNRLDRKSVSGEWLLKLRQEAERLLSGALGPSISTLVFQERAVLSPRGRRPGLELDPADLAEPDAVAAGAGRGQPAARHAEGVQREHHRKSSAGRRHAGRFAPRQVLEQRHGDDHGRGEVGRAEQRGGRRC